jgi:hypothetical protein
MASPTIELLRPDGTVLVASRGSVAKRLLEQSEFLQTLWEGRESPSTLQIPIPEHLLGDPAVEATLYRVFSGLPLVRNVSTNTGYGQVYAQPNVPFPNVSQDAITTVLGYFLLPELYMGTYSAGMEPLPQLSLQTRVQDRRRWLNQQTPERFQERLQTAANTLRKEIASAERKIRRANSSEAQEAYENRLHALRQEYESLENLEPIPYPFNEGTQPMTNAEYRNYLTELNQKQKLENDPLNVSLRVFNEEGGRRRRRRHTRKQKKSKSKSRKLRRRI